MKWFVKTAFREAKHTRFRGVLMLFSMVFGLTVLVSFSSVKQGFQQNFYSIATLLTGGDLRVEVSGTPTERLRHLLPKLGDKREAYWHVGVVDEQGSVIPGVRLWVYDPKPRPIGFEDVLRQTELAEVTDVKLIATEVQQEQLLPLLDLQTIRLEGGLGLRIQELIEVSDEKLPVWSKRLQASPSSRLLISSSLSAAIAAQPNVPWEQVWVYHFEGSNVRDRIARARYVLSYLMEEAQNVRMIYELPDESGFYYSFQLISNTLFLAAFSALMLGTLAYTVTFVDFSRGKTHNVALFRCLGGSRLSTWALYGMQVLIYGVLSVVLAGGVSIGIQLLLPLMIEWISGVDLEIKIYWRALIISLSFGGCFMLLPGVISIMPLLGCEPIEVLRSTKIPARRKEYRWFQSILIVLTVALAVGFCLQMVEDTIFALSYLLSTVLVFFGILFSVMGLRKLTRKLTQQWRSYPVAHASANLFRAQNHYVFTLTSIGFGIFLITFLFLFFEGFASKGIDTIAGYGSVDDERITQYLLWLQKVFFINQWLGITLLVIGVLAVFILLTSQRRTRLYESVVLGTLGATDHTIRLIMVYESVFAGVIASIVGTTAGLLLGGIVFGFFFDIPIILPWWLLLVIYPGTIAVMVLMGFANLKGIIGYPPLEVLRKRRHFTNW